MKKLFALFLISLAAISCSPKQTGLTYSNSEVGQVAVVKKGKIISLREVKLSGTSGVGTLGGAVAGGALGSQVGGNSKTKIATGVGGAIAGAVVGAMSEEALTKGVATEFIIDREDKKTIAIVQSNEENLKVGDKVFIVESADSTRVTRDSSN